MARIDVTVQQIQAVLAMIGDDDDKQLIADCLEAETDLHVIASRLVQQNEDDEGQVNALADQIETRKLRQERAKSRIGNRRDILSALMDITRLDKLTLPEATITKRAGKAKLSIVSEDAVPDEYQVTKKTPDKRRINEAFADAEELPNWLTKGDPEPTLTIRKR